jgi:hypothetical protein
VRCISPNTKYPPCVDRITAWLRDHDYNPSPAILAEIVWHDRDLVYKELALTPEQRLRGERHFRAACLMMRGTARDDWLTELLTTESKQPDGHS